MRAFDSLPGTNSIVTERLLAATDVDDLQSGQAEMEGKPFQAFHAEGNSPRCVISHDLLHEHLIHPGNLVPFAKKTAFSEECWRETVDSLLAMEGSGLLQNGMNFQN